MNEPVPKCCNFCGNFATRATCSVDAEGAGTKSIICAMNPTLVLAPDLGKTKLYQLGPVAPSKECPLRVAETESSRV